MRRFTGLLVALILVPCTIAWGNISVPSIVSCGKAADYSERCQGQGMVVLLNGKVLFEHYANGGTDRQKLMLASASKSLSGLIAVAAVEDGLISLDDSASTYIAEWKNDAVKKQITLRQLLSLTSGLTPGQRGNAIRAPGWKEIAAMPMTGKPGGQFDYGAYHINTFDYALENALKNHATDARGGRKIPESFEAYLKQRILDPAKVEVSWHFRCDDQHPQAGGGAFMTTRDFARVGLLVCQGGRLDDRDILKPESLALCFTGSRQNPAYGLTWWLKHTVDTSIVKSIPLLSREWGEVANSASLPDDLVAACGAGKQRLYVIPSMKLVIARQGGLNRNFDDLKFLGFILGDG